VIPKLGSLKTGLRRVDRHWREGRFDEALAEVESLLQAWPNSSYLLIMRASLTRLQDDEDGTPTLEDAKSDLLAAVDLDPDSPAALIELGQFTNAIDDDARSAAKYFEKAVYLCADLLAQALVSHAEALSEIGNESKALNSVLDACTIVSRYREHMRDNVIERIQELLGSSLEVGSNGKNGKHES
jgi:tetratricopeptide (TPR) repeat protein